MHSFLDLIQASHNYPPGSDFAMMGGMAVPHRSSEEPRPESPSLTSTSLLQRIRCRDQQAWQRLVEWYGPLVYGWCRHWGMQQCDAQDTIQEVFRVVAAEIEGFRKDGAAGTFRGWLWTIAKHRADAFSLGVPGIPERSAARTSRFGSARSPIAIRTNRSARNRRPTEAA